LSGDKVYCEHDRMVEMGALALGSLNPGNRPEWD
jgi:hypothetical protein